MSYKILITPRSFGKNNSKPWDMLKEKGYEIITNPYGRIMTEEEMIDCIKDVDGVILGVDPCNRKVLEKATNLKCISRYGVGLDNIDMEYAKERNIPVHRTVGANSNAVADYAFGLMLDITRKISCIDRECRKGNWKKIKTSEMWGKNIGVLGLGAIGKGVAKRASGFNMNVLAYDVFKDESYAKDNNIKYVDLETIYKEADFISLHLPLTKETKDLISYKEFDMMKDSAIVVNTARGGVINEDALCDALLNNKILGAGIDVFEEEPPSNNQFTKLDNIVIGSHCAASTLEAIDNMSMMATTNLINEL
ncbi:phosphoglycerate dehydrogenase [Vallitalea sp.]|jgi:D-3-phosphoglycerate dehydrogenase|uniref:phosphoglycerate dehydrogenase n=1 Tax=Vallitalea sp. TaxID=1882829 RepID=UPI0025F1988D|nr:phosphoglycerate dehydrogenase [Vallitalea sp.]MCT4687344.1 phosphoglycerate dehydrogenase [Vallitalea sp.]